MTEETKRVTVSELARTLAERRSAATAYVNIKVSAQGALQPDVNITPDTSPEDVERMTALALASVATIMQESSQKPKPPATPETIAAVKAVKKAAVAG